MSNLYDYRWRDAEHRARRAAMRPNRKQLETLFDCYKRRGRDQSHWSYLRFRRSAFIAFGDCLMVPWCGMTIGIERDGYAHS